MSWRSPIKAVTPRKQALNKFPENWVRSLEFSYKKFFFSFQLLANTFWTWNGKLKINSTIFGFVKRRKISYHKNVKKNPFGCLVKSIQQVKFVRNAVNFIKVWSKAKYAIMALLLTHLNYKNNSPTSTGSLVIENRGGFFYNATS